MSTIFRETEPVWPLLFEVVSLRDKVIQLS